MPQYLKMYGLPMLEAGFGVLPIAVGEKYPAGLKNWRAIKTTPEMVRKWTSNGFADAGIGINAERTPAIDVDILDKEIAGRMADEIDRIFDGADFLIRTGLAPKFLIPFRALEPFSKLNSRTYTDGTHEHKVEILGTGQQWVAYHTHPETGKPYIWFDGISDEGIRNVRWEELPVLNVADARRVITAFEVLATERVSAGAWALAASKTDSNLDKGPRQDDEFLSHSEPVRDISRSDVEALIHKLDFDSRDDWVRAGRILHHQYEGEGEGLEIWNAWATNSAKWQAETEATVWASFGARTDAPETIRSLMKSFPGVVKPIEHKPATPHPQATKEDPVPFIEGSQFAEGFEDIDWLIEDVVPRAQVGVVYGASGSGKTFFALDMACAIRRGGVWREKQVEQADAFYIAAEAGNGIKKRIAAYLQVKGAGVMPWFVDYQPNLATLESVQAISESVKLRSDKPGVIFVDTMALSHDGDENSSKDMSLLLRNCKILSDNTGALVILVHHTGKDESRGMRGSSAIYAGADFVLEISAAGRDHEMVVDKLKDGERGARFGFTLPSVEVGATPRGKAITSCYVKESDKTLDKGKKNGRKPLTSQQQIFIMDVFVEALGMSESMTETELVEAVKAKQRAADNVPAQSQSIKGSINKMVISGHICKEDEILSLIHSTHSSHSTSFE
jgi:hypothetical protein